MYCVTNDVIVFDDPVHGSNLSVHWGGGRRGSREGKCGLKCAANLAMVVGC